jgi:diguanylate cyclase (GGDEF)-like protein
LGNSLTLNTALKAPVSMNEESKLITPEATDHESFRQSIADLDRNLAASWRWTMVGILAVSGAIVGSFFWGQVVTGDPPQTLVAFDGFLILMLAFQLHALDRHKKAKGIRSELAEQLEASVRQRLRAEKLYGLSILDPLTGLNNRRFGEERLKEEISRAERNGDALAVLLFDLDYFKEINDQHGHAAGDLALKEFSRKVRRAIRACDVPVRIGGDEFLVILPECQRENIDVILSRIGSPTIKVNGEIITVCYSVGRAHYQVADTKETLLARADEVMYAAKEARHKNDAIHEPAPVTEQDALDESAQAEDALAEELEMAVEATRTSDQLDYADIDSAGFYELHDE